MADYDRNNIFARILRGELPCKKVYEDDFALAFHDINPQAPVHVLVIPKQHIARVAEAKQSDQNVLGHLLLSAAAIAKKLGLEQSGFRIVINNGRDGGETVPHLHVHVLGGRPFAWPPG